MCIKRLTLWKCLGLLYTKGLVTRTRTIKEVVLKEPNQLYRIRTWTYEKCKPQGQRTSHQLSVNDARLFPSLPEGHPEISSVQNTFPTYDPSLTDPVGHQNQQTGSPSLTHLSWFQLNN